VRRGDPRDRWKLANWEAYIAPLRQPRAVLEGSVESLDASLPLARQLEMLRALAG
jgi:hypothetical protein